MADSKISALPVGAAIAGTEALVAVQSGADVQTTPAALLTYTLSQANTFLAAQTIKTAANVLGLTLTGAAGGGTPAITATNPAQVAGATAGTPLAITAGPAIAGSSTVGAAAGGSITLTAGAAARLTSGNAAGGDINLTPGAGIGSTGAGSVIIATTTANTAAAVKFGTTLTGFHSTTNNTVQLFTNGINTGAFNFGSSAGLNTTLKIGWKATIADSSGSPDAALFRNAAGVVEVNNGTNGAWGALKVGTNDTSNTSVTTGLSLGHQRASGAAVAAGFGIKAAFNLETTTTADQSALDISAEWVVATHASRTARAKFNIYDTAAREALRLEASGGAAMIGFLGASAAIRQTAGAATAGVVYGVTEQTMLQVVYDALRTFGLTT